MQVKKRDLKERLVTTDEHLHQRTNTVLSYLELMERPDALFVSADPAIKRKLLAAFLTNIWIDDDSHQITLNTKFRPVVADLRHILQETQSNAKSAGEISDASSAEQPNLYLKVICSSMTSLVAGERFELSTSRL